MPLLASPFLGNIDHERTTDFLRRPMRPILVATICVIVLGISAFLGARPQTDPVKLRLLLVDGATDKSIAGIVRIFSRDNEVALSLPGLLDRMKGLGKTEKALGWHVVPAAGA